MTDATTFDLDRLAVGHDDAIAVVADGARTTYAELDRATRQVANGLLAAGIAEGDRVAYVGRNTLACVELLLGGARAGVVVTILNWRLHPSELGWVLADSGARTVVVTDEFAPVVEALPERAQVEHLLVVRDEQGPDTWRDWVAAQPDEPSATRRPADDVAVQLYTSGTTGRPKGAMLTHAGISATIPDTADLWQVDESGVVLSVLPMFHIAGVGTALAALWSGGRLVIDNDPSPEVMKETIAREGVTNLVLASIMLQGLIAAVGDGADLATLRTISYGAAPITEQTLQAAIAAFGCRILQVYGLTETTGVLTALDDTDHHIEPGDEVAVERLRSCGRPRPGVELRIVDAVTGCVVERGRVGEVQARTTRLMHGYWQRPEATAEAIDADGWFRTGDLGELDADGYLFLHDRLKDMIVSGGENIYPAEVEDALQWHPAVAEVAVVGVPDDRWGETPKAVVVLAAGATATAEELLASARDRLARYKCPTSVDFVDALPRNATGKVLRRELREPYWAGQTRRIG